MTDKVIVTNARGEGLADSARRSGAWGVLPTDTDSEVLDKFANYAITQNPGFQGDVGPAGPANSTYSSLALLKAADVTNLAYNLVGTSIDGVFFYETANAPYTADDVNVIKLDSTSLTIGALVRQKATSIKSSSGTVQGDLDNAAALGTIFGLSGNSPSVQQFDHNFLNSNVAASVVAAGTVDQPNIVGGEGFTGTFAGDGVATDFDVSPGFTVTEQDYRNILLAKVTRSTGAGVLLTRDTDFTVTGYGTGTLTITPTVLVADTEDIRYRIYQKANSSYSPLLNFTFGGYDNFNDGSGSMVVQFGAHHMNIGNTGGHNTFAGGSTNWMMGGTSYSFAGGLSHVIDGSLGAATFGIRGNLSGTTPFHAGSSGIVGGYSAHFGDQGSAADFYSMHIGRRGKTRIAGDFVQGSGASGDTEGGLMQTHRYNSRKTLTSSSTSTMQPVTGVAGIVMRDNSTIFAKLKALLVDTSNADFRVVEATVTIRRGANAASTALVGASTFVEIDKTTSNTYSAGTWEVYFGASAGAGALTVLAKGENSKTIHCLAQIEAIEVCDDAGAL